MPAKIDKRTIRKSVFRIETFGLLGKKPQFVKTRTAGRNPLKGKRMGTLVYLRAMQLASCVQQKIETCPILENVAGTAFAVDDRSTMVTARHVMSAWALEAVKANPGLKFEDVVQPFLLYDGQQALIYNSVQAKQRPKLKFWNAHPVPPAFVDFDNSMSNQLYTQSDYLEFGFDKPVFAANLKRSGIQIETAQSSLYAIGFPDLEGFRAVNDKEELKTEKLRNNSLTVSGGRFQGRYHAVFSTNAYSFNGMSGGPVLDAGGDVLGVYTSVLDARYAKRGMFELSFYISTDKKLLRETWDLPLWRDLLARQKVERRDLDSAH